MWLKDLMFEMLEMVWAGRCANPGVARTGTVPWQAYDTRNVCTRSAVCMTRECVAGERSRD